jgi:hypothetical protein
MSALKLAVTLAVLCIVRTAADADVSLEFEGLIAPFTNVEKHAVRATASMRRNNTAQAVAWTTLLRAGDVFNGVKYAQLTSVTGKVLLPLEACTTTVSKLCKAASGPVSLLL